MERVIRYRAVILVAVFVLTAISTIVIHALSQKAKLNNQIARLLEALDEDCDMLHANTSPAVNKLIKIGHSAIPQTLALIESGDPLTRMRGQTIILGIARDEVEHASGEKWPSEKCKRAFEKLVAELGDLSPKKKPEQLAKEVRRWRIWSMKEKLERQQ